MVPDKCQECEGVHFHSVDGGGYLCLTCGKHYGANGAPSMILGTPVYFTHIGTLTIAEFREKAIAACDGVHIKGTPELAKALQEAPDAGMIPIKEGIDVPVVPLIGSHPTYLSFEDLLKDERYDSSAIEKVRQRAINGHCEKILLSMTEPEFVVGLAESDEPRRGWIGIDPANGESFTVTSFDCFNCGGREPLQLPSGTLVCRWCHENGYPKRCQ